MCYNNENLYRIRIFKISRKLKIVVINNNVNRFYLNNINFFDSFYDNKFVNIISIINYFFKIILIINY